MAGVGVLQAALHDAVPDMHCREGLRGGWGTGVGDMHGLEV